MTNSISAAMTDREKWDEQNAAAREQLEQLAAETTQREWLGITRALDCTRAQIGGDPGLTMLAMGWVKEKRAHGGASWDRLLDMTDAQLEALHGFGEGDGSQFGPDGMLTAPEPADVQKFAHAVELPADQLGQVDAPAPGRRIADAPQA